MKPATNTLLTTVTYLALLVIAFILLFPSRIPFYNGHEEVQASVGSEADTLFFFTYPNYFDEEVVSRFGQENGVRVQIEYYESNEELLDSLNAGRVYDLIVPSDYTVQHMINEGMIQRIDQSQISNYQLIDQRFREMDYDYANQYSIPFFWGSVGITYDPRLVVGLPLSWDALFDTTSIGHLRNRMSILDDMRVSMGISLISLGYSPNTTDSTQIAEASEKLMDLVPYLNNIRSEFLGEDFTTEDIAIGMNWSGSSARASHSNRSLRYSLPAEGSIFFVDNLAIPVNAPHAELAHQFIDYVLQPRIAAELTNTSFFANPVVQSRRYIDRLILKGPAYTNPFFSPNIESIVDVGEATPLYEMHWEAFMDSAKSVVKSERIQRSSDVIILF